eukprot:PhF_6_TR40250/c0_g1_i2/m.59920
MSRNYSYALSKLVCAAVLVNIFLLYKIRSPPNEINVHTYVQHHHAVTFQDNANYDQDTTFTRSHSIQFQHQLFVDENQRRYAMPVPQFQADKNVDLYIVLVHSGYTNISEPKWDEEIETFRRLYPTVTVEAVGCMAVQQSYRPSRWKKIFVEHPGAISTCARQIFETTSATYVASFVAHLIPEQNILSTLKVYLDNAVQGGVPTVTC